MEHRTQLGRSEQFPPIIGFESLKSVKWQKINELEIFDQQRQKNISVAIEFCTFDRF